MKRILPLLLLITTLAFSSTLYAQDENDNTDKDTITYKNGSIRHQFDYVFKKSIDFTTASGFPYKGMSPNTFNTLRKNTIDSLRANRREILKLSNTVESQAKEIEQLKTSLEETKTKLSEIKDNRDSVDLFGLYINKYTYNTVALSIVTISLILFLVFLYKFKEGHEITKHAKSQLAELEAEFEEHRKNAVEREQKVRRQLIDEINKNKKTK